MSLKQHLESKTNGGLLVLLAVVVFLVLLGKLSPEAVDALKWIGGSFMLVRSAANVSENMSTKNNANN